MKKIASLFLVVTLFYNVLGLYTMFADQKEQMWVNSMQKTDDSNFEVIEVAINPYAYIVDSGFEYANEDFVIENKTYHVFKKRIINNVLKLYCLKNSNNQSFSEDFKKIVNNQLFDTNSDKENPSKKLMKSFIKDFIPSETINLVSTTNLFITVNLYSEGPQKNLLSGHYATNYSPPDMV